MVIVCLDLGADSTRNYSLTSHDSSFLREDFMARRTKSADVELSEEQSREEEKRLGQLLAELRIAQRNDIDWDRLAARRADRHR
jgi:hypothetical protein